MLQISIKKEKGGDQFDPPPGQAKEGEKGHWTLYASENAKKIFIEVFTIVNYMRKGLALPVEKNQKK